MEAAAGSATASTGAAGPAPSPAAPLADAALELFPALNDTALAHEIAADLGLVGNLTTAPQTPSRGGTPGWTTGLLAALISVAVLISMITVFVLLHRNLRRQRREVMASFLSFQEAEAAAVEAANTARQRFLLARASRAAALTPRQPQEPPVVVVQPDLSPSLCIKESLSRASSGGCDAPALSAALASGSSASADAAGSSRRGGDAHAAGEQAHGGGGPGTAAAALPPPEGTPDLEAGSTPAVAGRGSASAAPSSPVRRLALEFPGLGATVLLVLPSGPNSAGLLMWNDGSGASVLPGAGWRGWGVQPPHEPAPVFQSTIEMAAHPPQLQQDQQEQQQEQEQQEQQQQREQQQEQQQQQQQEQQQQQQQQQAERPVRPEERQQ